MMRWRRASPGLVMQQGARVPILPPGYPGTGESADSRQKYDSRVYLSNMQRAMVLLKNNYTKPSNPNTPAKPLKPLKPPNPEKPNETLNPEDPNSLKP